MARKKLQDGILSNLYRSLVYSADLESEDAERWQRYQVMKHMGWSYQEYQDAPYWLIAEMKAIMATEMAARETLQENV